MTIDIGIASYENPDKLNSTINAIRSRTESDFRLLIVDNNSSDPMVRDIIEMHASSDPRLFVEYLDNNIGYVGAVNRFFDWAESDYLVYCDNDALILTNNWDREFISILDNNQEVAMVFGKGVGAGGAYPINRQGYTEILWGIGCFWMLRKTAQIDVGYLDDTLGHQEEVDLQQRLRMAGWKMAITDKVKIEHAATASTSPEAQQRINAGIINWVNKWCKYFTGNLVDYYSENVIRFEDWPPNALYLEEFYKQFIPNINDNPEQVIIEGREYDLNKVPRAAYGGGTMYRGRII